MRLPGNGTGHGIGYGMEHGSGHGVEHGSGRGMEHGMGQVKLVAADLDDTLVRPDKSISDYTQRVFRECARRGILTAFATARLALSTLKEEQLIRPHIRIVSGGGMVLEGSRAVLFHGIDRARLGRFLQCLMGAQAEGVYVGCREGVYTNSHSYRNSRTLKGAVYCSLQEPPKEEACQVFFRLGDPGELRKIRSEFADFSWTAYRDGTYAVAAPGVSKARALLEVFGLYGIDPAQAVAFGDDEGDLEMLQVCGTGVAMGNALPSVKAAAAYVTKPNDEDGVAWFLEKYILGRG